MEVDTAELKQMLLYYFHPFYTLKTQYYKYYYTHLCITVMKLPTKGRLSR